MISRFDILANHGIMVCESPAERELPDLPAPYSKHARRFSTKTAEAAPRLRASMPSCPVPAKRSRTRRPSMSNWRMLKTRELPDLPAPYSKHRVYHYGKTRITTYHREEDVER